MKRSNRLLASVLSAAMLFQMGVPSVFAAQSDAAPANILGWENLEQTEYTLPAGADGAAVDELLPGTLTAQVEYAVMKEDPESVGSDRPESAGQNEAGQENQAAPQPQESGSLSAPAPAPGPGENPVTEKADIPVTWESDRPFTAEEAGAFLYTAVLAQPESFRLAEGVEMPSVTVTVEAPEISPTNTPTASSPRITGITVLRCSGQTNSSESAAMLFDGDHQRTKWCVTGSTGWTVFDIGKPRIVTEMIGYHCGQCGSTWDRENEGNTEAYALQVFNGEGTPVYEDYADNAKWTTVGGETANMDAVKMTAISMKEPARYFRLNVTKAGGNENAIRFYGLELYGKEAATTDSVTVSFDANGGYGQQAPVVLQKGEACVLPDCMFTAPAGYWFAGWQINGETKMPGDTVVVSEDITGKALWEAVAYVTLTFAPGEGGSGSMEEILWHQNESYSLPACTFTPPEGMVFAGWLVNGQRKQAGESITPSGDMELTAAWSPEGSIPQKPSEETDGSYFILDENGVITGMRKDSYGDPVRLPENLVIPSQIDGKTVTGIAGNVLVDAYGSVKNVWLPDTIRTLVSDTFAGLRDSPAYIDVGDGVETLKAAVFNWNKNLTTVRFGKNVKSFLPGSSVTNTFNACEKLEKIEVDAENQTYQSVNGTVYSKDGKTLVMVPRGQTGEFTVEDGTTALGSSSFSCCGITSVNLPATITAIGDYAFCICQGLTEIHFAGTIDQWLAVSKGENAIPDGTAVYIGDGNRLVDITTTGIDFSQGVPAEETVYLAGNGTVTFTPAQDGGVPVVTLSDATVVNEDKQRTASLKFADINNPSEIQGIPKVKLVLKGHNVIEYIGANDLEISGSGTLQVLHQIVPTSFTGTTGGLSALVAQAAVSMTDTLLELKTQYTVYGEYRYSIRSEATAGRLSSEQEGMTVITDVSWTVSPGSTLIIPELTNRKVELAVADVNGIHNYGVIRNEVRGGVELFAGENATEEEIRNEILSMNLTGPGTVAVFMIDYLDYDYDVKAIEYSHSGDRLRVLEEPLDVTAEGAASGNLETDGWHWDNNTNTLTLRNAMLPGGVRLPETAVIRTEGGSTVGRISGAENLTFDGSAPLMWDFEFQDESMEQNILVKEGASLTIRGGDSLFCDAVTVAGDLYFDARALSALKVTITATGSAGFAKNGLTTKEFTMEDGAEFEGNGPDYNIVIVGESEERVRESIHLPEGYLGNRYALKTVFRPDGRFVCGTIVDQGQTPIVNAQGRPIHAGGALKLPCRIFSVTFHDLQDTVKTTAKGNLEELPTPTREGFNFQGWFTAAEGGEPVTLDTVFKEDTTVYAHWKQNHVHTMVHHAEVPATCTGDGVREYWHCTECGRNFADADGRQELADLVIPATGHDWSAAEYTWSEDGKTCTAKRVCRNDGQHVETASATVTVTGTKAPTCTEKGTALCRAVFAEDWAGEQTKTLELAAIGHRWGEPVFTFAEDGKSATAAVTCQNDQTHTMAVENVTVTGEITTPATCTEKGTTTYTARAVVDGREYRETVTRQDVPLDPSHHGDRLVKVEGQPAARNEDGWKDYYQCSGCGKLYEDAEGIREIPDLTAWKTGAGKIEKLGYLVLEGHDSSWQKNSQASLTFRTNGELADFTGLRVDGNPVAEEHYAAEAGSTVITLKPDWLQTLGEGRHTVAFLYTDGQCEAEFKVAPAPQKPAEQPTGTSGGKGPAKTGDESGVLLWSVLCLASACGLTAPLFRRKKAR